MKRLIRSFLLFFLLSSCIQSYSQNTVIHEIPWNSDTVGMWGPSSTPWSINQIDTLVNFQIGPYGNTYSYVIHLPWPISDSVGAIFDYGAYFNLQLIFAMTGWSNGGVKVNYPTRIQMDFPPDSSFATGGWTTINSEYRELDPLVYSGDSDSWDIWANFPDAGRIELYLNLNVQAHADFIYSDPSDIFNIVWDTISLIPPINVNLDSFDLFLIDVPNAEYVIPWVAYHTDPLTGDLVVDSLYFLHDSLGWPIQFPAIFYNLIGISGDISIPDITSYSKWIKNEQRLYAWGKDEYLHLKIDLVKFVQMMCHYMSFIPGLQGLDAVYQAFQYNTGNTSIYLFTDPFSGEDFTIDLIWDLLKAEFLFTNTMNQTLSFEDTSEYTLFGMPIPPNHYPNVWNVFEFPAPVDYRVLDTLGNIVEQGTSDSVRFCADYDLQIKYPCFNFDSLPVKITHTIDPWLTNMVRDTIDFDFYLKVLDIWYSIGTASNPIISGSFILYQDTLSLATFAGPPLFGPPLFMPWEIDGYFPDTTFTPDEYLLPSNPALQDSLIVNNILCNGAASGSAQIIVTGGSPPYLYVWSDSTSIISTSDSVGNLDVGTYYVTVTDTNGCFVIDSVTITSNPFLLVDAGNDTLICNGSCITLGSSSTGGVPPYIYHWSPAAGLSDTAIFNPQACPVITTTYYVTITDSVGCTGMDSIIINVNPLININPGNPSPICSGNCITIGGHPVASGGTPGYTYHWSPAIGLTDTTISNPLACPPTTTTYTIVVTDSLGCTNSASVTVYIMPLPSIDAGTPNSICIGDSITIGGNPTVSGGTPPYTYIWSSSVGAFTSSIANPTVSPTVTTTYTVYVTDSVGCIGTGDITVTVNSLPLVDAGNDVTICDGSSIGLNASGGVIYLWTPITGLSDPNIYNPTASPANTTTYTVNVTDANGCSDSDSITVNVLPSPIANAGPDQSICFGDSALINASGGDYYIWNTGDTTATVIYYPTINTTYTVTVTFNNGCFSTDNISISIIPLPLVTLTNDMGNNNIHVGQLVTFTAYPDGYYNYEFFVNNSSVQSGSSNIYSTNSLENGQIVSVIATDNGCNSVVDSISMVIKPIPNAFSPNGDGKNDLFLKGLDLKILNRWGQKIYEGNEGWDGTYKGDEVAAGTYYFILYMYDKYQNKTTITGTVTLLRKD